MQKYYLTQGKIHPQLVVSEGINDNFLLEINVAGLNQSLEEYIPLREILSSNTLPQYTEGATENQYYSAKLINELYHNILGDIGSISLLVGGAG